MDEATELGYKLDQKDVLRFEHEVKSALVLREVAKSFGEKSREFIKENDSDRALDLIETEMLAISKFKDLFSFGEVRPAVEFEELRYLYTGDDYPALQSAIVADESTIHRNKAAGIMYVIEGELRYQKWHRPENYSKGQPLEETPELTLGPGEAVHWGREHFHKHQPAVGMNGKVKLLIFLDSPVGSVEIYNPSTRNFREEDRGF